MASHPRRGAWRTTVAAAAALSAQPAVRWWALVVVLNRLLPAMGALGLILAGEHATGSLADGALLLASSAAGFALAAPWRGRALDRRELRSGLQRDGFTAAAIVGGLAVAVVLSAPLPVLVVLAALSGVASAALEGGFRALLPAVVDERDLTRASALEAALGEASFLSGPAIAGAVAHFAGPVTVVWLMAAAAAGAALAAFKLPRLHPTSSTQDRGLRGVWRLRGARPVFLLALAAGVCVGLLESAMPARVGDLGLLPAAAGGFLTVAYTGSLLGGLTVAALSSTRPEQQAGRAVLRAAALFAWFGLGLLGTALAGAPAGLAVAAVAAGVTLAPLYAVGAIVVDTRLPSDRRTEGFAVFIAAQALGGGLGNGVTSQLLDHLGASALLGIGSAVALASAVALLGARLRPRRATLVLR